MKTDNELLIEFFHDIDLSKLTEKERIALIRSAPFQAYRLGVAMKKFGVSLDEAIKKIIEPILK